MPIYISFLRGINVSGQKKIKMSDLRGIYESQGFKNVKTYVQSGNVIFSNSGENLLHIEEEIEKAIVKSFGYDVTVIVRDKNYLKQVIDHNPFLLQNNDNPVNPYVIFFKNIPQKEFIDNLKIPEGETCSFIINGKEIYLYCPDGYGRTKINSNFFERKLKTPATARNWKTINAIYELAD